jgi:hypothetical protein
MDSVVASVGADSTKEAVSPNKSLAPVPSDSDVVTKAWGDSTQCITALSATNPGIGSSAMGVADKSSRDSRASTTNALLFPELVCKCFKMGFVLSFPKKA